MYIVAAERAANLKPLKRGKNPSNNLRLVERVDLKELFHRIDVETATQTQAVVRRNIIPSIQRVLLTLKTPSIRRYVFCSVGVTVSNELS